MISRFGDYAQSTQMTRLLTQAQTRSREIQAQLGSGKVTDRFESLGVDANRLLDAKTSLLRVRQFEDNNRLVQGRLEVMESAIASVFDLGSRLKTLLLQRTSDASGMPGTIATEAELMLEQVAGALNTEIDGRHLFGGSTIDAAPVAIDPSFSDFGQPDDTYYQGDDVEISARVDDDLSISYGISADREGFQELIGAFHAAIEADPIDDRDMLDDALALLNRALPKIADYRAEAGARHNQIDRINEIHNASELYLEREISAIEDVDVASAVTRLTQHQTALEAAMATIARLNQLSLTNFLG